MNATVLPPRVHYINCLQNHLPVSWAGGNSPPPTKVALLLLLLLLKISYFISVHNNSYNLAHIEHKKQPLNITNELTLWS
jgi:hypothetical protein